MIKLAKKLPARLAGELTTRFSHFSKVVRRLVMYPGAWLHRVLHPQVTVIGITGSAGKTTTKDICATVLAQFGPCVSTTRSQNYRISTAETLLRIRPQHKYAVLELSGSKPNAMDLPIRMARPKIGVLTIMGRDHYSAFKSLESIAQEKGKLVTRLPKDGIAVLNIDDPLIRAIGNKCDARRIWVGRDKDATLRLLDTQSRWPEPLALVVKYKETDYNIITRLHGEHLALSVLSTLGVAVALEIPFKEAIEAIRTAEPTEGRMQVVKDKTGVAFVRDDWKSPHWSLDAPFKFMADASAKRKIAVIGTISDSSQSPSIRYRKTAAKVKTFVDLAIFVGPEASKALKARTDLNDDSIQAFLELQDASQYLNSVLQKGDLVLLKGVSPRDHLVRLIHNRNAPISCWATACGKFEFCDYCNRLYAENPTRKIDSLTTTTHAGVENTGIKWHPKDTGEIIIVGLGNPGRKYRNTPHNMGFAVLDRLAEKLGGTWGTEQPGLACQVELCGHQLILFKPNVAINHSGSALRKFIEHQFGDIGYIVVAHDDIDLVLGQVKLKHGGGHAGHKGVYSIIRTLGTDDFERVRIGARSAGNDQRGVKIVLNKFSGGEKKIAAEATTLAVDNILSHCGELLADQSSIHASKSQEAK